jgi:hypothetical protein
MRHLITLVEALRSKGIGFRLLSEGAIQAGLLKVTNRLRLSRCTHQRDKNAFPRRAFPMSPGSKLRLFNYDDALLELGIR